MSLLELCKSLINNNKNSICGKSKLPVALNMMLSKHHVICAAPPPSMLAVRQVSGGAGTSTEGTLF